MFADVGDPRNPEVPGLGDLIPKNIVLTYLARRYAGSTITLVARRRMLDRFRDFLQHHTRLDDVVACPDRAGASLAEWAAFIVRMRRRRFDLCVIDPASGIGVLPAYLCGIPERVGIPIDPDDRQLLTRPVTIRPEAGRPDLLDIARGFAEALGDGRAVSNADLVPDFPFVRDGGAARAASKPVVSVHAGGGCGWNRRWPLDAFVELCRRLCADLGARVYLLGAGDERVQNQQIAARVKSACPEADIADVSGATLNETANYLDASWVLVGNDSSPVHVAGSLGKPLVVVCGPNDPSNWKRLYAKVEIVTRPSACRAMSSFSVRRHYERQYSCREFSCAYAFDPSRPVYPKCLAELPVDDVWIAVHRQLAAVAAARC